MIIAVVIAITFLPGLIMYLCFDRPHEKEMEKLREKNRLFWSIRDLEFDLYGKWYS